MLVRQNHFAIEREAGKCELFEELHILLLQTEVVVFFEELLGVCLRRIAGHYVPKATSRIGMAVA